MHSHPHAIGNIFAPTPFKDILDLCGYPVFDISCTSFCYVLSIQAFHLVKILLSIQAFHLVKTF